MAALRCFKMFLLVMVPHLTVTAQNPHAFSAVVGVGINLPCKNLTDDQKTCVSISWFFSNSAKNVTLFERGQIHQEAAATGKRYSTTLGTNCSLDLTSVKYEDSGRYTCRRINASGQNPGGDTVYNVHIVSAASTKPTTTFTSTLTSAKPVMTKSPATEKTLQAGTNPTSAASGPLTNNKVWLIFIIFPVAIAALIITVVIVINRKRTKGTRTQMGNNMADPEDGVPYVSITYTKKTAQKVQDKDEDDDGGATVTYSAVKSSSSYAAASTDPSSLYAAINKPKK